MADKKISELTEVSSVTSSDHIVVNSLGSTKKGTLGTLATWLISGFTSTIGGASQTIEAAVDNLQSGLNARAIGSSLSSFVIGQFQNYPLIRLVFSSGDQRQISTSSNGLKVEEKPSGSSSWSTLWNIPRAIKPNDSISLVGGMTFCGFVSSGLKTVWVTVPLSRPIDSSVTGATFTPTTISVRGVTSDGSYLMQDVSDFSNYTITCTVLHDIGSVRVSITKSTTFSSKATNNTPVCANLVGTVLFR